MKKLRDFIQQNKEQFDDLELPQGLWESIESKIQPIEKKSLWQSIPWKNISIAASLVLLIGVGIGIYTLGQQHGRQDYYRMHPELAAQWDTYERQVEAKRDSLQLVMAKLPMEKLIEAPFSVELEDQYKNLQQELKTSPNQATTLKALIDLLQIQLHFYSYQLELIQQQANLQRHEHTL
jgi:hypothetical protein